MPDRMETSVEAYFSAVPAERKTRLAALHQLVVGCFPDIVVDMKYKMPTYQFGEGWVALANQKNYISLYTCGYHHIEDFKTSYPQIKTGKGCINFRDKDDMPLAEIEQVVKHAIEHPK